MIRRFRELKSTQTYCLEHIDSMKDMEAVVCEVQTGGIGRSGRSWVSSEGSLLFSVVVRGPQIEDASLRAAEGVKDALERLGAEGVSVKWPNDVYIEAGGKPSRKIAGVLVHTVDTREGPAHVIGIGVNLSGEMSYRTLEECGIRIDKEEALQEILKEVRKIAEESRGEVCSEKKTGEVSRGGFVSQEVYFEDRVWNIVRICDRLEIERNGKRITVDPEMYSYLRDSNSIVLKR